MVNPLFLWPFFNSYVCLPEGNGSMSFHHLFPFKNPRFCSRFLQPETAATTLDRAGKRAAVWLTHFCDHQSGLACIGPAGCIGYTYINIHMVCDHLFACVYIYVYIYLYIYMYRVYRPAKIYPWWVWFGVVMKCDHQFVIFCNHMELVNHRGNFYWETYDLCPLFSVQHSKMFAYTFMESIMCLICNIERLLLR